MTQVDAVNFPTGQPGRVLVIDDDPVMRQMIVTYLENHQCPSVALADAAKVMAQVQSDGFSLIILDVHLGRRDGFEILRQIREKSEIPVIMITGERQDEIDRIVGLELGADDYLTKPLSLRELLARARATLRRHELGRIANTNPRQRGGYRFAGWELRRTMRTLTDPEGVEVTLTRGEYALLVAFLDAPGRTLSREQLLQTTRTHEDVFDRTIDVQVLRLRRKLEDNPAEPRMIRTVRGVGYLFATPVERLF